MWFIYELYTLVQRSAILTVYYIKPATFIEMPVQGQDLYDKMWYTENHSPSIVILKCKMQYVQC